jgi:hypothetical protein
MAIHRQRRGKSPPLSKKFAARMIRTRAEVLLPVTSDLSRVVAKWLFDRLGHLMESHIGVRTNRVNALTR